MINERNKIYLKVMTKELTRQELFDLVWTEPMVALAKKFEISDVGLRKVCKRLDIPIPKRGHWQRVRAGRKILKPTLPSDKGNEKISLVETERPTGKKVYPWTQRQIEIEKNYALNLIVPDKLRNPDILIVAARRSLTTKDIDQRYSNTRFSERGTLDIAVQPKLIRRALTFMDTLIKLLRARGHEIEIQYEATYVVIHGYRVKVQLRERSKTIIEQAGEWPSRTFLPTGILVLKADAYGHLEWADGKRKLEERLSHIVARLEIQVEELLEIWRQNRIREEEEKERARLREEARKRKEKELDDFKRLSSQADRWKKVLVLREFLSDAKSRATFENRLSEKFESWHAWAMKKADWYDPYMETDDELLRDVDREHLSFKKQEEDAWPL